MATRANKEKKPKPYSRLTIWQAEKKFDKAIKAVSESVKKTGRVPDEFGGYKSPQGPPFYANGFRWQFQVHAVCRKSDFIKNDEVLPISKKWAIAARLKGWIKYAVDWSNNWT